MSDKLNSIKKIADQYGELLSNICFKAPYCKDISIVLELNESGLSFTRIKSADFEEFFYIIE